MNDERQPVIYLKQSCPFCLKLRIFLTEAGLADRFAFEVFADGDDQHQALRVRFEAAGQQPSFPALEHADGSLQAGSDELIEKFAAEAGIDAAGLPLLNYYLAGVFGRVRELFMENRRLREQLAGKV